MIKNELETVKKSFEALAEEMANENYRGVLAYFGEGKGSATVMGADTALMVELAKLMISCMDGVICSRSEFWEEKLGKGFVGLDKELKFMIVVTMLAKIDLERTKVEHIVRNEKEALN